MHISYPSDQGSVLILGDAMVKLCHWQGYPSEARIELDEGMHRPLCFWIDGDDSYNEPLPEGRPWFPTQHKVYSMNLHLPDFEGKNETVSAYNDNAQLLCNSDPRLQPRSDFNGTVPIFVPALVYPGDLDRGDPTEENCTCVLNADGRGWASSAEPGRTGINGEKIKGYWPGFRRWWRADRRRDEAHDSSVDSVPQEQPDWTEEGSEASDSISTAVRRTKIPFGERLTISREENREFFASTVCQTPQLVGPHYVNLIEGLFCDMEDRTTWPLCDTSRKYDCFDMDNMNLLVAPELTSHVNSQLGDSSMGSQSNAVLPIVKKQIRRVHEQQ